uniref:ATP synthase subunit gamma n=1 Tax=Phallusia mammillata TaxID=59560 RepID=A0A6F9D7D0_9ASCI|nr:ATP synthase subunit gamma, mitochondrial-like [Phallusia mammillata]
MKMISAAKFAQAQKAIVPARAYGVGAMSLYDKTTVPAEENEKKVFVAISSDRGLCGALHSNLSRALKAEFEKETREDTKIISVGEKSKVFFQTANSKDLLMEFKEVGRNPPTFVDCAFIADQMLKSGFEFNSGKFFYNYFKSAMSQIIKEQPFYSVEGFSKSPSITVYDSIDEDVVQSYQEFQLANAVFYTLKENYTSEQGARMVSMDGATKNAGEMIDRMSLLYNRTRQAVITTELIEIISGMTAL